MLYHKGYIAYIKLDAKADLFCGWIVNTCELIAFQGKNFTELEAVFIHKANAHMQIAGNKPSLNAMIPI